MGPDFDVQTRLTQIAMAMRPMDFIADAVCPRVPSPMMFTFTKGRPEELLAIPETRIGRASRANRVEAGADDTTLKCEDHGLEDPVPASDEDWARSQMASWDPQGQATMNVASWMYMAREKRVADLYFNRNTYASTLRSLLSGNTQWSNYANSNPVDAILAAMDKMLIRPNTGIFGQATWTKFRQHPKVVKNARGNDGGEGAITREDARRILELDRIEVGRTWSNTANKGQDATYSRLWGKHFSMHYLNDAVTSSENTMPTFGFTAEFEGMMAGSYNEPGTGVKGAEIVKIYDRIRELVAWKETGYFFENAVA